MLVFIIPSFRTSIEILGRRIASEELHNSHISKETESSSIVLCSLELSSCSSIRCILPIYIRLGKVLAHESHQIERQMQGLVPAEEADSFSLSPVDIRKDFFAEISEHCASAIFTNFAK